MNDANELHSLQTIFDNFDSFNSFNFNNVMKKLEKCKIIEHKKFLKRICRKCERKEIFFGYYYSDVIKQEDWREQFEIEN